ncbi:hypothetical protein EV424DRAFT_1430515 [Suillus variegatus]|nr:hypothetical protein EV424DRAFT_1430515 [Suillus variegatus]
MFFLIVNTSFFSVTLIGRCVPVPEEDALVLLVCLRLQAKSAGGRYASQFPRSMLSQTRRFVHRRSHHCPDELLPDALKCLGV